MPDDPVKLAILGKVEVALPDGRAVHGKVLPLRRALYYWDLYEQFASGDAKQALRARTKIIQQFPKEVKLEKELNQLTLAEFWEAFAVFFGDRRSAANGRPPEAKQPLPDQAASSPGSSASSSPSTD